ncbi:dynein light chain Tctex-type protein 2-like isoform X1 [Chiloscyllium plagiosum]|uniref:dynein light chain Tctex-type protein 2-like isoform X1 n=1 Tax=Chiloscyllium plagiosum TaxID=36176 RepID=UPI001CB81D7D|nr:dynein light chain Tctex-type protein 2-like isoform X1 [Chiloscyllium plagiosum]
MEEEEDEILQSLGEEMDDTMDMDELKGQVPLGRMGLPLRKKIARPSVETDGRRTGGRNRRSSVFEENAFHEILKERLHDTILQVVHVDKSELDEDDDDVFEEPLTWKPSLVKQKMANTYKMVPDREFDFAAVARRMDELFEAKLRDKDIYNFKALTLALSDDVRAIAKDLAPERFKLIARVFTGELKNQGIMIASRFLWDPEHDSWCESHFHTTTFFVVGTVYAVYYE